MIEILKEAIGSLKHAETFINSRQKMHKEGVLLHQETINKLAKELEKLQTIEDVKRSAEELIENKFIELEKEKEKR